MLVSCPSADVSSQFKKLTYCPGPGGVAIPCAGQDILGIQTYNNQLQADANAALNQCNCNNAWVLNGKQGPNPCAGNYPVSGNTSIPQPIAPSSPAGTTDIQVGCINAGNIWDDITKTCRIRSVNSVAQSPTSNPPSATNVTSSTNQQSQAATSGVDTGIGVSGLEIILAVIGVGIAFMSMQKGH